MSFLTTRVANCLFKPASVQVVVGLILSVAALATRVRTARRLLVLCLGPRAPSLVSLHSGFVDMACGLTFQRILTRFDGVSNLFELFEGRLFLSDKLSPHWVQCTALNGLVRQQIFCSELLELSLVKELSQFVHVIGRFLVWFLHVHEKVLPSANHRVLCSKNVV